MAKITIYEAREVEITSPKFYLYGTATNWAFMVDPNSDRVRVTCNTDPLGESSLKSYLDRMTEDREISESMFYEIVAKNYRSHLECLEKMAMEWGIGIPYNVNIAFRKQIDEERAAELRADERAVRAENFVDEVAHDYHF